MFREVVLLHGGFRLEALLAGPGAWRLALFRGERLLVEYSSASAYEVKSVEKLRYDFERDVERALGPG
ncbi:MAG: hypothetical protein AB1452_10595 [Pseudomonadota bacterium]